MEFIGFPKNAARCYMRNKVPHEKTKSTIDVSLESAGPHKFELLCEKWEILKMLLFVVPGVINFYLAISGI